MDSKEIVKQNEERFQEALKNDDSLEEWICINFACHNISKMILSKSNVSLDDDRFYDRLQTATLNVYSRVKEGVKPKRLSSYVYWFCVGAFQGPKAKKEDLELSYEFSVENGYDVPVDILGERMYELDGMQCMSEE